MSTSKASPLLAAPTGALLGDGSRTDNFSYQSGDIAWMLTAIVLIVLMIPGVGSVPRRLRLHQLIRASAFSTLASCVRNLRYRCFGSLGWPPP